MKTAQNIPTTDTVNLALKPTVPLDPSRRRWITATTVVGGTGLVVTAVPFVTSLAPSAYDLGESWPGGFYCPCLQHVIRADNKRLARLNLIRDMLSRLHYEGKKSKLVQPDPEIAFEFHPRLHTFQEAGALIA